ncbi:FAS1 domain-containing protein, partial [Apodospora peruviana]
KTLTNVLYENNNTLSVLNNFLAGQAELFDELSNATDITVLAPSNDALNQLADDSELMDAMATDEGLIAAFLKYHVFQGVYFSSNFTTAPQSAPVMVQTLMNASAYTNVTGGQRVQANADGSGAITFVSGMGNSASVRSGDYNFTGGTIHIVDGVLTIPSNVTETLINANLTAAVGALKRAKLIDSVDGEDEITVFAPDNAAFNAVGSVVSGMTSSELASIMGYHIIRGKVLYTAAMSNGTETTSEGNDVRIRMEEDGGIFVNSAKIVRRNLLTSNGVVHVCDNVLNPENESATPNPTAATQKPAFSGAEATNSVPFTSGVKTPNPTTSKVVTATVTAAGPVGSGASAPAQVAAA